MQLDWQVPVYLSFRRLLREGTEKLCYEEIMRYLDERALRLAEEPQYAKELAELDQRIEDEARAQSAGAG